MSQDPPPIPPTNPYAAPRVRSPLDPNYSAEIEEIHSLVRRPALALMIVAGIMVPLQFAGLMLNLLGVGMVASGAAGGNAGENPPQMLAESIGGVGGSLFAIAGGCIVFYGAWRMSKLRDWNLAMGVSILACIPCISPCCLFGLPIGIWSVTVLNRPEVRQAFAQSEPRIS